MRFPQDQAGGVYHPSSSPITRIGLALEPWPGIEHWIRHERLDALFLHRPWQLDSKRLPDHRGVLAYHLAFDATLTFSIKGSPRPSP